MDSGLQLAEVTIETTLGGASARHVLPVVNPGGVTVSGLGVGVTFGQTVRVYADPNQPVLIEVIATRASTGGACTLTFSGQAIDLP